MTNYKFYSLETGPVTNKADIWTCGMVIWEMIALSPPHVQMSESLDESYLDESLLEMQGTKEEKVDEQNISMDDGITFFSEIAKYGECLNIYQMKHMH